MLGEPDETGADTWVAMVVRGDHELNDIKAEKMPGVYAPLTMAKDEQLAALGLKAGSIGPVDLNMPVFVDRSAAELTHFVCGANQDDHHNTGTTWDDVSNYQTVDIRNVVEGDPSPDGNGNILIKRGIEVGHIFQLGTKYSSAMNCGVLNENGKNEIIG